MYILYDYKRGLHIELNESAGLIWKLVNGLDDLEEVCKHYAEYYGIDYQIACDDVNRILKELKDKGIIEGAKGRSV